MDPRFFLGNMVDPWFCGPPVSEADQTRGPPEKCGPLDWQNRGSIEKCGPLVIDKPSRNLAVKACSKSPNNTREIQTNWAWNTKIFRLRRATQWRWEELSITCNQLGSIVHCRPDHKGMEELHHRIFFVIFRIFLMHHDLFGWKWVCQSLG